MIKDIIIKTRKVQPTIILGEIDGGGNHTVIVNSGGRIWAWGLNTTGQLGDNSITNKFTPVSVLGAVKTFCQIAGGDGHTIAIDKDGRAWGWGGNSFGQLGDNSITSKLTPVSVLGAVKTFCQISGGQNHSLAIDKNGRAWGWGLNNAGKLGDNSMTSKRTPVSVLGAVKTFCQIGAANNHTVAIDKNGRAWAWGFNSSGQLGDNTAVLSRLTPVSVLGAVKTFCKIAAAGNHTVAIDKNGRAWAWGENSAGQLGDNTTFLSRLTPVSVLGAVKTFCQIAAGDTHTAAIDKDGRVWAWGLNASGQLGDNTVTSKRTPVSVLGAVKTFCKIAAGTNHTVAIDKNGRAWAWGLNSSGQIGDTPLSRITPVSVLGAVKTFCQISGGQNHSLAIDKNGRVWAWGLNSFGQLGDNTVTSKRTPVSILGAVKTFCQIAGGSSHSLAIDKNGRVWGWGANTFGQLGDNTILSKLTPVSILGATKTFCQIAGGGSHSLAIDKNGRAWAWGSNSFGQLGDNSITQRNTPVSVLGAVKTFCQIIGGVPAAAGGSSHSLAIDKNGRVWAWGLNTSGQLGDNTVTSKRTPVSVLGAVKTFCQIVAGAFHSLAIDRNGRVWGWGANTSGQLGDNTILSKLTPVSILGATKTFCQITAGRDHSLAIDKNGRAWAWGLDTNGQLGDIQTTKLTPVRVCTI